MKVLRRGKSSTAPSPVSPDTASRFHIPARLLTIPLALLMALPLGARQAAAQSSTPGAEPAFTTLHQFVSYIDGSSPIPDLFQASDGNFYGSSASSGGGEIYKITPNGAFSIVHSFPFHGLTEGSGPAGTLIQGAEGNFYGTTNSGGTTESGTIFKMTPAGDITLLHSFRDGSVANDGYGPATGVIMGSDGNFYGTTWLGGLNDAGTIFKMTPGGVVTILHSFDYNPLFPLGDRANALLQGADGNFYGTTTFGGPGIINPEAGDGVIFKITPAGVYTVLHSFGDGSISGDGATPSGKLIQGPTGTIYGTASNGGSTIDNAFGSGIAYKISPSGTYVILHRFHDGSVANDGVGPNDGLVKGSDGSFYGTTGNGGSADNGTAFKMTQAGAVTILHSFSDVSNSLVEGWDGNLYGTTSGHPMSSSFDAGSVFRISTSLPTTYPALTAPTGLAATAATGQVTLTWTASSGAVSYNIYRGTSHDGEAATPIATGVTTTSFINTGLANEVTYYYKVKAVSSFSTSAYSFEANATPEPPAPDAPANLTATPGNTQITLNWTAGAGANSYNIYRGTSAGGESPTPIATGVIGTSYTNTGLINGAPYYYYAISINGGGVSAHSNEAGTKPQPPIPAAPTNLIATPGNGQVSLSWTASAGAASYKVYRSTTPGGETAIAGVTTTTYINTGLTNGKTYYYKVAAVNGGGLSPLSDEASATPAP